MAGSYNHIVTDDGNLGSNQFVVDMLENGGDVFEAVEEMYGMIWYLAAREIMPNITIEEIEDRNYFRKRMKEAVQEAQKNYQSGLKIAKEANGGDE